MEEAVKGAERSSRLLTASFCFAVFLVYDGFQQFYLQAVLYILIDTVVRQTIFIIESSYTDFVDITVIIPQTETRLCLL